MAIQQKVLKFLEQDIWRLNLKNVKGPKQWGIRFIRTLIIAWRGFKEDQCQLKASALTFYTLLSVVPVIAMLFGIAKGFGLERKLETEIKSDLSYNQEVIGYVFEFANSMLENTKGGLIAGFGVLLLVWTVMKVIGNIEQSFNDIWEIKRPRTLIRKFTDYMAIVLVTPVLTILSGSLTVLISTQVTTVMDQTDALYHIGPVIYFFLQFLPIVITILMFTGVYMILPNTRVDFSAALYGAVVAAIFVQLVEWGYLSFQIGVSKYNAIYGGFAALPLFLVWVQTNWLILLLGAELSFAAQNQSKYEFDLEARNISTHFRYSLALAIVKRIVDDFKDGKVSMASNLSNELKIPSKLVRTILNQLVKAHVITEIKDEYEDNTYQPAIDINLLDINFVRRKLNETGVNSIEMEKDETLITVEKLVEEWEAELNQLKSNKLLKDL